MTQLVWALSEQLAALGPLLLACAALWEGPGANRRGLVACASAGMAALLCAGVACWALGLPTNALMLPVIGVLLVPLKLASDTSAGCFAFVVSAASLVASCYTHLAIIADAFAVGDTLSELYLAWPGMAVQWALEAASTCALWRFFRTSIPELLASKAASRRVWATAWLIPALPLALGIVFVPTQTQTLLTSRVGQGAACVVLVLAFLVFETCHLLCKMARGAHQAELDAERLRRAEMLAVQQRGLERRMDEARAARHDLRQHWAALGGMLEAGDAAGALAYVRRAAASRAVDEPLRWCANPAANAVLAYYLAKARELKVRLDVRAQLPPSLPQSTTDVVVVLGNLLENATLALADAPEGTRTLSVRAQLRDDGWLVVAVDNACATPVLAQPDGTFRSTRHEGPALGVESVRMTAEASGGEARFECAGGTFRASVLLGPRGATRGGQARQ